MYYARNWRSSGTEDGPYLARECTTLVGWPSFRDSSGNEPDLQMKDGLDRKERQTTFMQNWHKFPQKTRNWQKMVNTIFLMASLNCLISLQHPKILALHSMNIYQNMVFERPECWTERNTESFTIRAYH